MARERIPGVTEEEWNALPAAVRLHIEMQERRIAALESRNAVLEAQVAQLSARVSDLEARLAKNSSNSHKPPSSDGPVGKTPRTQSERKPSGKKPGGQPGHSGNTLRKSNRPDHRVRHPVNQCGGCGEDLSCNRADQIEERQVFDLPPMTIVCTAHEMETNSHARQRRAPARA